jgi:hypothetical protein
VSSLPQSACPPPMRAIASRAFGVALALAVMLALAIVRRNVAEPSHGPDATQRRRRLRLGISIRADRGERGFFLRSRARCRTFS